MKIKNFDALATTPERRAVLEIAEKGLEAIDTVTVLERSLKIEGGKLYTFGKEFQLSQKGKLIAVCIGKCAGLGAMAFDKILGDKLDSGAALGVGELKVSTSNSENGSVKMAGSGLRKIKYHAGTHPMPSEANVFGTKAVLDSLSGLSADDTVLFLVSGGGSTLLAQPPCPADKIAESINSEKDMLGELFKTGATIQEINTVRKHMSLARGGFLAMAAYPAQVVSIIFSDVPGDELGFVSSGPTVKDDTTVSDALNVVKRHGLELADSCLMETPKDDKYFAKVYNILGVSNKLALEEMKKAAEALGFTAQIKNFRLTGEAREAAKMIAGDINASDSGTVLLYCGETTVTVKVKGRGGRNQELALAALPYLNEKCLVLSLASDGRDNGPHAGALADIELSNQARIKDMDPAKALEMNDSSNFFETVGGSVETGDTGSNVSDLIIAVAGK